MTSATPEPVKAKDSSKTKADRLVLVNLSAQPCEAWLDAVRKAGQPWHKEVVDNLAKAKLLLKDHPRAHILVCYDAPERQVADCIAKQRLPSQALANWVNATEALLDLYRGNFERMTLVRRKALERNAKELFSQLASRSGVALGRVAVKSDKNQVATDDQEQEIQHLLALQVLQHSSAEPLAQELEVSTLPLLEPRPLLDLVDDAYDVLKSGLNPGPDILSDEYEDLRKAKQNLEDKLKDVQEENDLAIEQLHKTQEELEQYILGNKGSSVKLEKLQGEIQKKNEKLHSFSQKNKRLTAQLKEMSQQLKEMKQSKSWKVTAPLRKSVKALGGGKGGAK
ncbi:hypothetical protein [Halomonas ramblicola]|uniref:hypothetical protein n=1 Tax=Halomonas ramblicola TaxID=747349 RepID=UPI0025B4B613|nr:hypothetical protein [Halomonas ramblicola]MDN3522096.1 hypothetical protein [Halomonas ramblicola]